MPALDRSGWASAAARPGNWLTGLLMLVGLLTARRVLRWLRGGHTRSQQRSEPRVDQHAVRAGHETRDVPVWPVVVGVVAVVIGIGVALSVATWYQAAWVGRPLALSAPPGRATPVPPPPPPEPRLEEVPGAQLQQLRAAEDRVLTGTAWVDRQAGIARIPIDRAIDLLVKQPLPARPATEVPPTADGAASRPSDARSGRVVAGRAP